MLSTTRRGIQYPSSDRADRADIALHIGNVALATDLDVIYNQGTDAARIAAAHQSGGGRFWWATDTGLLWWDDGTTWRSVTPALTIADGSLTPQKIAGVAVITSDSRLSDLRIPINGSVDNTKVSDGALAPAKITGTAVVTADARLSDQRVPSANSIDNTKVADNTLAPAKITGIAVVTADSRLADQRVPTVNSVDDTKIANQAISPGKINGTAVVTADARLSDQRIPTANSVDDSKVAVGILSPNRINGTAVITSDSRLTNTRVPSVGYDPTAANVGFPTTGLFNGYRFTLLMPGHSIGGYVAADCIYRADLDGTYPWHVAGSGDLMTNVSADFTSDGYIFYNMPNVITAPRAGWWHGFGYCSSQTGGGGGCLAQLIVGGSTYGSAGWGNVGHHAYSACVSQVPAGGTVYFQGQSSVTNYITYRGQVGARPIRLI